MGFNSHGVVAIKMVRWCRPTPIACSMRRVPWSPSPDIHAAAEFLIDGQDGIKEPVGMAGVRLEARVHLVTAAMPLLHNVVKCCQRAGLHVVDLVFAPFAAAEAVLSPEEKELGVAVIEIGAGTTGLLAFANGAVKHTAVLSVGGNHVSSDIAAGLRTPFREAELSLPLRRGADRGRPPAEMVEVPTVGGRAPRELAAHAGRNHRAAAGRDLPRAAPTDSQRPRYPAVIGNGADWRRYDDGGHRGLAERVFQLPVRLGTALGCDGSTRRWSRLWRRSA
jgi:cell division protein FtsA